MNLAIKQQSRLVDTLVVMAAVLASIALIRLVTGSLQVTAAYAGGLVVLGLVAFAAGRRRAVPVVAGEAAVPDWSVTGAAIEQPGIALAITDRANRLVCANAAYELWFGSAHAPPRLPVDGASGELLARAARAAWREGESAQVTIAGESQQWAAAAQRAGRADDYLIWRFAPIVRSEPLAGIGKWITGTFGRILSAAGIEVALVGPDGAIRAASPGFARRAAGDDTASMAGPDFGALLRSDVRDRIYFAREGRKGSPQTLVSVPLADPEVGGAQARSAPGEAPSLMMLFDAGVGLGGWGGEARGQTPQLESLLEQLPLGLAMTDRDGHFLFANPAFRRAAGLEGGKMPPYPSDIAVLSWRTTRSEG